MSDAMISFKVTGVDKVVAALKQAGLDIAEAFGAGLVSGALLVNNDAKRDAPYKLGNLKRSIHVGRATALGDVTDNVTEPEKADGEAASPGKAYASAGFAAIVKDLRTGARSVVSVGTNVDYAARQEFGYTGPDKLGRTFNQPPRPYLRPALDNNHARVGKEVGDATRAVIAKVVKGA
jgi:phage gpG-like protein